MNVQSKAHEYAALSFSASTARALEATNMLANQVRSVPAHLMTEQLQEDRALVLNASLPRLLDAHLDARRAGDMGADGELEAGLEHICEELQRILKACQERARDTLATASNYLEQRYPVDDAFGPHAAVSPLQDAPAATRELPLGSLEGLFQGVLPVTKGNLGAIQRLQKRWSKWVPAAIVVPLLAYAGALMFGEYTKRPEEVYRSAHVDIAPVVDSVRRKTIMRDNGDHLWKDPSLVVELHGTVKNMDKDVLKRSFLQVELISCPYKDSDLQDCDVGSSQVVNVVGSEGLKSGATARWKDYVAFSVIDPDRNLRVRVTPETSTFKRD